MATFALFISALCCVSATASLGQKVVPDSSQSIVRTTDSPSDAPAGFLYDDMVKYYGAVESFGVNKLYNVISANFKVALQNDQQIKDTVINIYKVRDMIKNNPMISSELFKETAAKSFLSKTDEDKFNAIFDSLKSMFVRINHMDKFLKSLEWNPDLSAEGRKQAEEYFKKHVYGEQYTVDVNGMAAFCKWFWYEQSYFYKLALCFDDFVKGQNQDVKGNFVQPSSDEATPQEVTTAIETEEKIQGTSAQGRPQVPEAEQTQQVTPAVQPSKPTTGKPTEDSAASGSSPVERPAGNLTGQQDSSKPAGSSFTFGGLTVATLCYFVLSAF
uniref:Merozoite surface antigen-1 n=1 Tax=Babesia bovis TaxID=5865 RepID=R4WVP4_BABBO|nr:merozoite surface antigen-1 [Babesia bovis]